MAKRKFLLAIGQSNSTAIGDAQSWEDNNPLLRIRSPRATPSQISQGSYSDIVTMPTTFPGGPQTGRFGEGPKRGAWQSFDCKGLAAQNVKMLTFYDPIASYFNLGSAYTIRYPGTCTAVGGCTSDTLVSTAYWQYDPVGIKIIRKKTGIEHTIVNSSWTQLTNAVKVSPAMVPTPTEGEDFSYEIVAKSIDTGKIRFANMFGGLSDLGGALEAADTTATFGNILNMGGVPIKAVMRYAAKPLPDSASITFRRFLGLGDWLLDAVPTVPVQSVVCSSENGELLFSAGGLGSAAVVHNLNNGDRVRFAATGAGVLPTGISAGTTYYVVKATARKFKVSSTLNGSPVAFTNAGTAPFHCRRGVRIAQAFSTATLFATANKLDLQLITYYSDGLGGGEQENTGLEFETNQPVAINRMATGVLPTNLSKGTTYYIRDLELVSSGRYRVALSLTPSGTAITLSGSTNPTAATDFHLVHAPETLYINGKPREEDTILASQLNAAELFAASSSYGLMEGERVRFSSALPIPSPFVADQDYFIKRKTQDGLGNTITENDGAFQLSLYPGGAAVANTGTALCALRRVDLPYIYELTNEIGKTGYVLPFSAAAVGINAQSYLNGEVSERFAPQASLAVRMLETWRGSLSGIKLRSISGTNVNQSVTLGDVTYELSSGQYRSTVSYSGSFSSAVNVGDKFVMEPPAVGGVTTPWHKWAYWLPWCPFEGRAYGAPLQNGTLSASVGGAITFNWAYPFPPRKNTAVQFDSLARVLRKDVVAADNTINNAGPVLIVGTSTTSQLVVTGPTSAGVGLAIEFLTGPNVGVSRPVSQDSNNGAIIYVDPPFPSVPQIGDGFRVLTIHRPTDIWCIETVPVSALGEGPFGWLGKWMRFTSGALAGQSRQIVFFNPDKVRVSPGFSAAPADGDQFEIVEQGLPAPLICGKTYFVKTSSITSITVSDTYDGPTLTSTSGFTGYNANVVLYNQEDKYNPFPPGFNYPNHYTPVGGPYQPYDGYGALADPALQGHYVGLASKLYDYFGETMYVLPLGIGATTLTHAEVNQLGTQQGNGYAWFDPDQQLSWSPGEPNNCFARLLDMLDAAKNAFAANGDTGECVGVVWMQGESDTFNLDFVTRYRNSCVTLKTAVRNAIKERGLFSGSAHKIPWIHPKVREKTGWLYAKELNQAIDYMVEEDSYSRTFALEDVTVMPDNVHYDGAGMSLVADRAYTGLLQIYRVGTSEVEICNLALANIGETAKVTSIDPPDGSAQAALCARFYPLARDTLLEMGSWSFAIKRKTLVEVDNPRTEWEYAYEVPGDASGILAVMPPDALDDWVMNAKFVPQKFVIETDVYGKRVLYTNQENAVARYNAKITDTTVFSNLFVIALSWHLSSMLAGPLIKGEVGAAEARRCAQMATAYMMQASSHDKTTQAEIKPTHTPSWISIR